jgi:hypothetical protein
MPPVYLLGSGFSRAISEHMPVMDALSAAIQSDLRSKNLPPIPGEGTPLADNFEQWLSYLIEEPPWLTDGQRRRNSGAFSDVADSLHEVLSVFQMKAAAESMPNWLLQLVKYWQATNTTVITFNYDLLVEMAWLTAHEDRGWLDPYTVPVAPIGIRTSAIAGADDPPLGIRLLKLHGSLNWRYSGPSSPPGDTVYDIGFGRWGIEGVSSVYSDVEKLSADKIPMIVPPAAVKSPYYVNHLIRTMWRQAAQALREADELVIMGFSLPPSDQIVSSLLATELNKDAFVFPVDYGTAIVKRLQDVLGSDEKIIPEYADRQENAIPDWVQARANLA